jgi:hypothetical protein
MLQQDKVDQTIFLLMVPLIRERSVKYQSDQIRNDCQSISNDLFTTLGRFLVWSQGRWHQASISIP